VLVVDDLWYSPETLDDEGARRFLGESVVRELDELQCFHGSYAPYWKGGSLLGFREVVPFMEWVNRNQIELTIEPGVKSVLVRADDLRRAEAAARFDEPAFRASTGEVHHNPLADEAARWQEQPDVASLCRKGAQLFESGDIQGSARTFMLAAEAMPQVPPYPVGVCLARAGRLEDAASVLAIEHTFPSAHPKSLALLKDVQERLYVRPKRDARAAESRDDAPPFALFSMPKAFKGHIGVIQRNAIRSWMKLVPRPEIILFGSDEGTAEIAQQYGLPHVPEVKCSEYGTPLVSDLFARAEHAASCGVLAYVNADVMLTQEFAEAVRGTNDRFLKFLMIGEHRDVSLTEQVDFDSANWITRVRSLLLKSAKTHSVFAIDYFVFTRGMWPDMPPFALGRTTWDNWLVHDVGRRGIPVVDATSVATVMHQEHDYGHLTGGRKEAFGGAEAQRNRSLGKDVLDTPMEGLAGATWDADWQLTPGGPVCVDPARVRCERAYELGLTNLRNGVYDEALGWLDKAAQGMSDLPGLHCARAQVLAELGCSELAAEELRAELALRPDNAEARRLLATLEESAVLHEDGVVTPELS